MPADGNCLFESVARQLDKSEHVLHSHQQLRQLTCHVGRTFDYKYNQFLQGDSEKYFSELEELSKDGVWNIDVGDLVITILHDILMARVVVFQPDGCTLSFPDDSQPIDDNTIVIVREDNHYDATKLICPKGKYLSAKTY